MTRFEDKLRQRQTILMPDRDRFVGLRVEERDALADAVEALRLARPYVEGIATRVVGTRRHTAAVDLGLVDAALAKLDGAA